MGRTEKKVNKRLIGAIIGTAVLGVGGFSLTPKGKSFRKRMLKKSRRGYRFLRKGWRELQKEIRNNMPSEK